MQTRVLHVSDLHFGRNDKPESIEALARLIEEVQPEVVIASGDLTHRGLRSQHEKAAAFLRGLELPLVAIPGNHDIPYTFPKRFTKPWLEFERLWDETEPVYRSDTLARRRPELGAPVAAPVGPAPAGCRSTTRGSTCATPRTGRCASSSSTITCSAPPGARARSRSRSGTTCSPASSTPAPS